MGESNSSKFTNAIPHMLHWEGSDSKRYYYYSIDEICYHHWRRRPIFGVFYIDWQRRWF
jgi:hypothetical protein